MAVPFDDDDLASGVVPAISVLAGRNNRGEARPVVVMRFASTASPHRVRAAMHRMAAAIDEHSPASERWRTEVRINTPDEERYAGTGGRVLVCLASYSPVELDAENARALRTVETAVGLPALR